MIHMVLNLVLIKSEDMPDHLRKEKNRAYTRQEIRAILEGANTRILLGITKSVQMSSSEAQTFG